MSRYDEIRAEVERMYGRESQPDDHPYEKLWRTKGYGARWRNRVGFPRLTASEAAGEAQQLLREIPLSVFRSDPELAELLRAARAAVTEFSTRVEWSNWRLLQTPPKKRGKEGA